MWFIGHRAGRAVAWAVIADQHGGTRVPGELQAHTLEQLRAMLPAGLRRWQRASMMPSEVVEVWD